MPEVFAPTQDEININSNEHSPTDCLVCPAEALCKGENHPKFSDALNEAEKLGMDLGDYIRSLDGAQNNEDAPLSEDAPQVTPEAAPVKQPETISEIPEIKFTNELDQSEIDPQDLDALLENFENGSYELESENAGSLVKRADGEWDVVFKAGEVEYSIAESKDPALKEELRALVQELVLNGHAQAESEGYTTLYIREGSNVIARTYQSVEQKEFIHSEEDDEPVIPVVSPFEKVNQLTQTETGISIKPEAPLKAPVEVKRAQEVKNSVQHTEFLKFFGIKTEVQPENTASIIETPYTVAEIPQHFEAMSLDLPAQNIEVAEIAAEQSVDQDVNEPEKTDNTEKDEQASQSFSGSLEIPSTSIGKSEVRSAEVQSSSENAPASIADNKPVAKEILKPAIQEIKEPIAIAPDQSGPNLPDGPSLESQIQKNENGTETIVSAIKSIEVPVSPEIQTTPVENLIIDAERISTQVELPSESAPADQEIFSAEVIPTIEEIVEEKRQERIGAQNMPQSTQTEHTARANQTSKPEIALMPETPEALEVRRARATKEVQATQDALAAIREISSRGLRNTEILQQYQPGDQPAPAADTDSTAETREAELLKLAA